MASAIDFDEWLQGEMAAINIDDSEVYSEYIKNILKDETSNQEERLESLEDILEGIVECDDDAEKSRIVKHFAKTTTEAFADFIQKEKQSLLKKEEAARKAAELEVQRKMKALTIEAEDAAANVAKNRITNLTAEEKEARRRILENYDAEADTSNASGFGVNHNKAFAQQVLDNRKESDRQAARQHKKDIKEMQRREKEVKEAKIEKRKGKPKKERRG